MDNYKRKVFLKNEIKRTILKSIKLNKKATYSSRYLASYYLSSSPRVSSRTNLVQRCNVSGRVWSVSKRTRTSRFVFRESVNNSLLPGFKRAS